MRKNLLCFLLLFAAFGLSSCLKSDLEENSSADINVQLSKDDEVIKKFISDNQINATRDASGVYYVVIASGEGDDVYTANTVITATYTGRLLNGSVFDSGTLTKYRLAGLIDGWRIGLQFIKPGGKIRLLIPSVYGYGSRANGSIPANSVLDFDIELKEVK